MTPPITFFVAGHPAPQGSKRHVGGGRLIESSKKVKPWRQGGRPVTRDPHHDRIRWAEAEWKEHP